MGAFAVIDSQTNSSENSLEVWSFLSFYLSFYWCKQRAEFWKPKRVFFLIMTQPKDQLPLHFAASRPTGSHGAVHTLLKLSSKDARLLPDKVAYLSTVSMDIL